MSERLDYPALYKNVTGSAMLPEDADQLRNFLLLAPQGLANSPTYVGDLMIRHAENKRLRETVSQASDTILNEVQTKSETAVRKMVKETVERIHKSSPSAEEAKNKAFLRALWLLVVAFTMAFLFFATLFAWGWIRPLWFSQQSFAKIHFAEAVEEAVGGDVDWHRREAPFDESLAAILDYASKRGTNADPYHLIRLYESCSYPGQESYRSRGKTLCRYDAMTD